MRLTLLLSLTFLFSNVYSQQSNDNEIVAEGSAMIKVKPDIATLTLTVEKRDSVENKAIKMLNLEIDKLVKSLFKLGFTNKFIKISDYKVSSSLSEDGKKSYTASNGLKIEFGLDTKLIDAFYKEIQASGMNDLDIEVDFHLSDRLEKLTRLKLVQDAINDAKVNANNISKTLDIKLIRVKKVLKYNDRTYSSPLMIDQAKFPPPPGLYDLKSNSTSFKKLA